MNTINHLIKRGVVAVVMIAMAGSTPAFAAYGSGGMTSTDSKGATGTMNAPSREGGSASQYLSDTAITAKVKAQLLTDSELKTDKVSVETTGGVVTLSGSVPSEDQKTKVGSLAQQTDGVKSVLNNLMVKAD